jgi:hypothetical protein
MAISIIIVLFQVVSLSYLAVEQITVWRTSVGLWSNVIEKGTNRDVAYTLIGPCDKASEDFNAAVLRGSNGPTNYFNRGHSIVRMRIRSELSRIIRKPMVSGSTSAQCNS